MWNWLFDTGVVNQRKHRSKPDTHWTKTQYSNLIRYIPSGTYYARLRVVGKLIRKSLKTDVLSVRRHEDSRATWEHRRGIAL